jgi:predicted alpha/beta hydrolase family esterase
MNSPLPPDPSVWLPTAPPVLLVPGYLNSGPDHWQSHWEKRWPQVRRVDLGRWDAPDRELWQERFQAAVQACSEPRAPWLIGLTCPVRSRQSLALKAGGGNLR